MYNIRPISDPIAGLKYRPSIEPERSDDVDFYSEFYRPVPREFSEDNQRWLKHYLLQVPDARCVVEIGVQRNPLPESSTGILLSHKPAHAVYIGIDIENKSHLNDPANHIHTLQMDSSDRSAVYALMDSLGVPGIDFLFIDGWHSVRQCVTDWQYTERLSPQGTVMMHDTNVHPGPVCVFEAIDEAHFEKTKLCTDGPDWGISVIRRKHTNAPAGSLLKRFT